MNLIKKNIWLVLAVTAIFLPSQTLAFCPVCTIAIGAGIGLSRWIGVDDGITGLWVGGLIISLIIWFLSWLEWGLSINCGGFRQLYPSPLG